jgi:hypothetical protein
MINASSTLLQNSSSKQISHVINAPQFFNHRPPALIFEGKHMFFSEIGPKLCVPGPAFCFFIIDISKFLWPRTVI